MSDLRFNDKKVFEKIFQTDDTVLCFSDVEFTAFFRDFNIDIESKKYSVDDDIVLIQLSKLKKFWAIEPNATVIQVTAHLLEYAIVLGSDHPYMPSHPLYEHAAKTLLRLKESTFEANSESFKEKSSSERKLISKNIQVSPPTPFSAMKECAQVKALELWKKSPNLKQRQFKSEVQHS